MKARAARAWLFFAAHALAAAGAMVLLSGLFMPHVAAVILLAVSIVAWWIAWRSAESLVGIVMGVIVYLVTLGIDSRMITTALLVFIGSCSGAFYWASATLKLTEK